ncbi:hypothetical protein FBY51_0762 [Zymomonas mobilis]|nr:hypothetical protein ZZ6_1081 [Zymomonas mobilis subsp. mobilis ATCC 29191]TQK77594.1 hypothetical protein FBY53_0223 [Zymomonas mobilis]TQL15755.1 hypothetical protein FBY51_0762 [Zymomonas mobilis]
MPDFETALTVITFIGIGFLGNKHALINVLPFIKTPFVE